MTPRETAQPEESRTGLDLRAGGRRTVWLTGGSGFLGSHLLPLLGRERWRVALLTGRHPVPAAGAWTLHAALTEPEQLASVARGFRPHVIFHAAAMSTASACLNDPGAAWHVNVRATRYLTEIARECGAHLLYVSTDMVFSGREAPYAEEAAPSPVSLYGASKAAGEEAVQASGASWTILRCPLMYGLTTAPWQNSALGWLLSGLRGERELPPLFHDEWRSFGDVRHVARAIVAAAERGARGIFHLGGPERMSRAQFGRMVARIWQLDADRIREASIADSQAPEPRPPDLTLRSERARRELGFRHPPVEESLREFAAAERGGEESASP